MVLVVVDGVVVYDSTGGGDGMAAWNVVLLTVEYGMVRVWLSLVVYENDALLIVDVL